jgi:hypothetical protein
MLRHGGRRVSCSIIFRHKHIHHLRSLSNFRVKNHIIGAQHTRHWPRGEQQWTDGGKLSPLRLAVKQYIPFTRTGKGKSKHGHVTFIAAHANGFPKVSTLLNALLIRSRMTQGLKSVARSCTNLFSTTSMRRWKLEAERSATSGSWILPIRAKASF